VHDLSFHYALELVGAVLGVDEARPKDSLLVGHNVADIIIIIILDCDNGPRLLTIVAGSLLPLEQHRGRLHVAIVVFHEADHVLHRERINKLLVQDHLPDVQNQMQGIVAMLRKLLSAPY